MQTLKDVIARRRSGSHSPRLDKCHEHEKPLHCHHKTSPRYVTHDRRVDMSDRRQGPLAVYLRYRQDVRLHGSEGNVAYQMESLTVRCRPGQYRVRGSTS